MVWVNQEFWFWDHELYLEEVKVKSSIQELQGREQEGTRTFA